jgi:hypothetical protein
MFCEFGNRYDGLQGTQNHTARNTGDQVSENFPLYLFLLSSDDKTCTQLQFRYLPFLKS